MIKLTLLKTTVALVVLPVALTTAHLNNALSSPVDVTTCAVPTGTVLPFAGGTLPTGFLLADGTAVDRSLYPKLFAVIGTTYGSGNGSTTFNLPDLRGRTTVGRDDMGGSAANRITSPRSGIDGSSLGASGGSEAHLLTIEQIPAHNHSASTSIEGAHNHGLTGSGKAPEIGTLERFDVAFATGSGRASNNQSLMTGAHLHTVTLSNTGGGEEFSVVQPSMVMNYIIKY